MRLRKAVCNLMSVIVRMATTLQAYCGLQEVCTTADSVEGALQQLKEIHPRLYSSICDETGSVRRHINLFVNSELVLVHGNGGLKTALRSGDVLTIWTAVSGG